MPSNIITRIFFFPLLFMTFGFGCYAGYTFQLQVKTAIDTYQVVKGFVVR